MTKLGKKMIIEINWAKRIKKTKEKLHCTQANSVMWGDHNKFVMKISFLF
jgi:hypothetical protein